MALKGLVRALRRAERELEKQLEDVRNAISSLEFGGGGVPALARRPRLRRGSLKRGTRKLSASARRAISLAQKRRWAKVRAAAKS
jgi:hypothetical protein